MSKKVDRRTLYMDGNDQNVESAKAVESITEQSEEDQFERHHRKIGKSVVRGLRALTQAGVVVWRTGEDWAKASIGIRVDETEYHSGVERVVWLTNDHDTDEQGEPTEESFCLDRKDYEALVGDIRWDVHVRDDYEES